MVTGLFGFTQTLDLPDPQGGSSLDEVVPQSSEQVEVPTQIPECFFKGRVQVTKFTRPILPPLDMTFTAFSYDVPESIRPSRFSSFNVRGIARAIATNAARFFSYFLKKIFVHFSNWLR